MSGNADQIAYWNTDVGRRWAEGQDALDRLLERVGALALAAAAVTPGERVLDVGCGCGATTFALADLTGATGSVVGVDVSAPMLERARGRAGGRSTVTFLEADASSAALPGPFDVVFSRFGVMFFADPVAAFTHLRAAMRPGGRLAFVCWRAFLENEWARVPAMAVIGALGIQPEPVDLLAPGPFAFADGARIRAILEGAGFKRIEITASDAPMALGGSIEEAVQSAMGVGPAARLTGSLDEAARERARRAIMDALQGRASNGEVTLGGAVWVVTAEAP